MSFTYSPKLSRRNAALVLSPRFKWHLYFSSKHSILSTFHSSFLHIYSTACNHPKWSSCRIGCHPFSFSKNHPKCLTSNPLSQIVTSNPRLQPDTHFAVDMFPYKKTELFQKSGFKSKPPKKPGNTPLSGTYLSFLDIKTTVSTCTVPGNISTLLTLSTWYPNVSNVARSCDRLVGLHEI